LSHRIEQVNMLIRRELSELIQHQVKDPRLTEFISVTGVSTSPDLRHARIFVSCIGSDTKNQEVLTALGVASGFLRNEMSHHLKLRRIPELSFIWDDSIRHGDYVLNLIEQTTGDNPDRPQSG